MVELLKDLALSQDWLDRVLVGELVLPDDFNSVETPCIFFTSEYDATEPASADDPYRFKVIY